MRKAIICASATSLVVAAALAAAPAIASQSIHPAFLPGSQPAAAQGGSISVPPFVTRGYPNYPDGTPCIGTPKDPTAQPDKKNNPCDGVPLKPEQIPGPFPPAPPAVNVTAPGGQTAPVEKPADSDRRAGEFAPYEDGTPCVGRPKDLFRRPNKETNPCVTEEPSGKHEPIATTTPGVISYAPSGKKIECKGVISVKQRPDGSLYIECPDQVDSKPVYDKPRGPWVRPGSQDQEQGGIKPPALQRLTDRPGDFTYKTEPGDSRLGEIERKLTIYRPTGQVIFVSTSYTDGRVVEVYFRYGTNQARERMVVSRPHPAKKGYYISQEALYDGNGHLKEIRFYNPDGTLDRIMVPEQDAPAPRPSVTPGGKHETIRPSQGNAADNGPTPYLPPFTALRPAGEVNDVTPQNRSAIEAQLRNSKRPVFRLNYSSKDRQAKNMSDWLDRAAKANPAVVFLRMDTTKFAVSIPEPSASLDIPRPVKSFSLLGYQTDAQLDKFLRDGLATWTPVTHQNP